MNKIVVAVVALLMWSAHVSADVRIGTWNLERLSVRADKPSPKDFASIAKVASQVDLLAVQEVMNEEGLRAVQDALQSTTHEKWSILVSDASGRKSYKEMYGFVWRDSAVQYLDGASSYIDNRDQFAREPFSARFRAKADNATFVAATVHIVYGKSAKDRSPEINALASYWDWLGQTYHKEPVLLMGDFNTDPTSPAWAALRAKAKPLMTQDATTLSETDGKFAHLYDNIFVANDNSVRTTQPHIYNFPHELGMTHKQARKTVSDHAPIFVQMKFNDHLSVGQN